MAMVDANGLHGEIWASLFVFGGGMGGPHPPNELPGWYLPEVYQGMQNLQAAEAATKAAEAGQQQAAPTSTTADQSALNSITAKAAMLTTVFQSQPCASDFGGIGTAVGLIVKVDIFDPTTKINLSPGEQAVADYLGKSGTSAGLEGGDVIGFKFSAENKVLSFESEIGLLFHELDHNWDNPNAHDPARYLKLEEDCRASWFPRCLHRSRIRLSIDNDRRE